MATVFLDSPTNSTLFTTCCEVAICDHEKVCPRCRQAVSPETRTARWETAYGPIRRKERWYGNWYPNHGEGRGFYERQRKSARPQMASPQISMKIAMDIAYAYRDVEAAESLLADISKTLTPHEAPDIRDVFGRRQDGLQLGVPSGSTGTRLFNVPWVLARPIIEAHIAQQKAIIAALSEQARIEMAGATNG